MSQKIDVNITPNALSMPTLYFSQGDVGRTFQIEVVSSEGYDIPSGATVKIQATKPSGFGFSVTGTITNNVVEFSMTEAMTDEAGRFPAELEITSGNTVIGTANFYMRGEVNPHPDGTVDGSQGSIVPELTLLVERVEAAAESVHDLSVSATTLAAGSDATATYDSTNNSIAFGIPRGADGDVTRAEFNQAVTDLKSELNLTSDGRTLASSDFMQGIYENSATPTPWNKRICISKPIVVRAGAKFVYTSGSNEISFGLYNFAGNAQIESKTWHTASTETTYTFLNDGLFFVQFRKTSGTEIAPSEYDATCTVFYGTNYYLKNAVNDIQSKYKYIDENAYGNTLGISYQTGRMVTSGGSWSQRTIANIDFKAGYTYTVRLSFDRAFNVSGYARIYDANANELSVSPSVNGKSEIVWTYTPVQDYANAVIKIAYASADIYQIDYLITYSIYNAVRRTQQQMSMVSVTSAMLRKGSLFNASNTDAVTTPVIKTQEKRIEIINTRPNTANCVYQYNITTITAAVNDVLESPTSYDGYTEIRYPYYTLIGDARYGVQFSVLEYNTVSNQYSPLTPDDFERYPLLVYSIDDVPLMYQSYINARLQTIKALDASIGKSGDSFIFCTDQHQRGNDYISPYLAKHIIRNSSVKRLVYGGDYINTPDSKELAIQQINNAVDSDDVIDGAIFMQGNHETNPYGTGAVSESELYGILNRRIERFVDTNRENYYAFDNIAQKIRYIVLNTGEDGEIDSTQAAWVKTVADELSSEWNIIILSHMALYTAIETGRDAISLYGVVASVVDALADTQATICCWICGHTHVDASDATSYDFPIICVTCDSDSQGTWYNDNRDVGTINRGAFDVFHVDTANHKIYATRIGGGKTNVLSTGDLTDNDREWTYTA